MSEESTGAGKQLHQWKRELKELKSKCKQECGKTKDKKEKKEIQAKYEQIEKDLQALIDGANAPGDEEASMLEPVAEGPLVGNDAKVSKGHSKAARKRHVKEEREKEMRRLRDLESAAVVPLSTLEGERMQEQRDECGFALKDIASDGNCLFRAFEHQLKYNEFERVPAHGELRALCADFLLENADDFQIFMEEPWNTDEGYRRYVDRIRDCEWGGQVEITAMSRIFNVSVEVYQGKGEQVIEVNRDFSNGPVRLSFHRHLYTCPHYNSLVNKY
eukprot:GEMP01039668.1.p1 GENE.GEMP01039668.1~~GEMP01039668.1.p1  ORF type:complete len:274 (+),score=60.39 GEMP01039668.1:826-1647(+)